MFCACSLSLFLANIEHLIKPNNTSKKKQPKSYGCLTNKCWSCIALNKIVSDFKNKKQSTHTHTTQHITLKMFRLIMTLSWIHSVRIAAANKSHTVAENWRNITHIIFFAGWRRKKLHRVSEIVQRKTEKSERVAKTTFECDAPIERSEWARFDLMCVLLCAGLICTEMLSV